MLTVVPISESQRAWLAGVLTREWGSARIVTRGKVHNAAELAAFVALWEGSPAGVITYRIEGDECEVVTLNSAIVGRGAASALLKEVQRAAREAGCRRVWLITTNDNMDALAFYQKRGFRLKAVYPNAIEEARRLKPEIPSEGKNGIPVRDEIELEFAL